MRTERRCTQRKRPGGISYFEFEAGSGGIVLDASEKGLGFQAADAVHQIGPSRIWISPRPEERIELTGDVVWTDKSRKTGGLRFIETGVDSSSKIRSWLGQAGESEPSGQSQGLPMPAWAARDLGDLQSETGDDANVPRSPTVSRVRTKADEERAVELHSIPGSPSLFTSNVPWESEEFHTSDGRIAHRVATGFLVVVLVVAGVVLFDMFHPEVADKVGNLLIQLGEKINGSSRLQPQDSSPPQRSGQAPAQPLPMTQPKPDSVQAETKPDVLQREIPGNSDKALDSSGQGNKQGQDLAMPGAKEVPGRLEYRRPSAARDRSAEATRLWSAVGSGDSSAEVDLARLYLMGDGVPRNCEQAKVLLRAAAKGGSGEARQELKKLRSRGCW